ncbi:MAG: hypothetical protein R3F65_23105 [bacterium]
MCGDGEVEGVEQCDDGNRVAGDGCAPDCTVEPDTICGDGVREGTRSVMTGTCCSAMAAGAIVARAGADVRGRAARRERGV